MQLMLSPKQQYTISEATKRWNIWSGAVRSSKTYTGYFLLPQRVLEQQGNKLLIGKTERTLERNIIDPMRDIYGHKYISSIHGKGVVTIFGKDCYCLGANDKRAVDKIRGLGLAYAYGDEITTWHEDLFEMLKSRLSEPNAVFDGTCNPEGPNHWMKKFIDRELKGNNLKYFSFRIDDNPFLDPAFVRALKAEYTGMWYRRYILGEWCLAEGVIWDMFDEKLHVVKQLPKMIRYYVGVDYGTSNATVFLLIGRGDDGNYYIIKEYYHAGGEGMTKSKTDIQYAKDFVLWLGDIKPYWIFIDPSAKSFRVQLYQWRNKFPTLKRVAQAINDVLPGIRRVASMLHAERLFVHSSCVNVRREIPMYVWDEKAQERGEDEPMKENDHSPDALRYVVMGIQDKSLGAVAA